MLSSLQNNMVLSSKKEPTVRAWICSSSSLKAFVWASRSCNRWMFNRYSLSLFFKIYGLETGLSLRSGGRGFPSATKNVAPGCFHSKTEKKIEPQEIPSWFDSLPTCCIYPATWNLSDSPSRKETSKHARKRKLREISLDLSRLSHAVNFFAFRRRNI